MSSLTTSYLICATPRSGSTLLCERLILTGLAGNPNEWLLPATHGQANELFGVTTSFSDPAFFGELAAKTSTRNGVFGVKVMWPAMESFSRGELWNIKFFGQALRDSDVLPNVHYIRISRRDKIRQAVSFLIAHKTNLWHQFSGDEHDRSPWPIGRVREELDDPIRRRALQIELSQCLEEIYRQDLCWERFFRDERIAPLYLEYETLVADHPTTIRRALDFLGISTTDSLDFSRARLVSLSDDRNELLATALQEHIASGHKT